MVKMMFPVTVQQAVEKAKLQELALETIYQKYGLLPKGYPKSSQQIEGTSKASNQVVQETDEVAVEEEDGVHAADEKYDEVLRMGMVVAKNEEQFELNQAKFRMTRKKR